MRYLRILLVCGVVLSALQVSAADLQFAKPPAVVKNGAQTEITFALKAPSDVEVAVLNAKGDVVRHLAAGALGGEKYPPAPLKPGLEQSLAWDGKDDFGQTGEGGPFKVRVRAGSSFAFDRYIGNDPYRFGAIDGLVADENGLIYMTGSKGGANQMAMCLRVFDGTGKYLREVIPFPADLSPDAMKDIARWDEAVKAFRPRNLRNLNPDFYGQPGGYWGNSSLTLVKASPKTGIYLSNGNALFQLEPSGAVKGERFRTRDLGKLPNTGGGPTCLAISPDGKYVYLSGPWSSKTRYGHKHDPQYPPGRIYRAAINGTEPMVEFATIAVDHKEGQGGAWAKALSTPSHFTAPKGPVCGIDVDAQGRVYVADRERGCIAVFDDGGKEVGTVALKNPFMVSVHPKTGAIYATQYDCIGYHTFSCVVHKFENFKPGAQAVATYSFPSTKGANREHRMAVAAGEDRTLLWMSGVQGGLVPLEDKGTAFEPVDIAFKANGDYPADWTRLTADFDRDEIYISNGTSGMYRYNGETGEGGALKRGNKAFPVVDIAVGYNGLLYTRSGGGYSGPLERYTRDLEPAPFSGTGTHVLSPYIYSRMGCGFAERGLGVGPDGSCYISFMYKWVAYSMGGFGPDGKPIAGKYLKGQYPSAGGKETKKYAAGMDEAGAITNTLPNENGGIRVDLQGNIYIGFFHRPKDFVPPQGFEKDQGYRVSVGSVVKFTPDGLAIDEKTMKGHTKSMEGAVNVYPGLAPFSSSREAFGANTCCVCRLPRFDLDRYGRLAVPNAMTNSVLLYDNAGNPIAEFGAYGNFDSKYVADGATGEAAKPRIGVPEIPVAWPTCAGFTRKALYVLDSYNRRAVRVRHEFALAATVDVK